VTLSPGLDDARNFAASLLKGQPNRQRIALTTLSDKVRELLQQRQPAAARDAGRGSRL
jgi:hypothetical protein